MPTLQPWPAWSYFPHYDRPPAWIAPLVDTVAAQEAVIRTERITGPLTSDVVLATLASGLQGLGYTVETGKTTKGKVRRPVLFGENGAATVTYEVDGVHDELGIVLEIEAGRGARGNAAYRDVIRASLIVDVKFLVLMMPVVYRINASSGRTTSVAAYRDARDMLEAVYASRRLKLPFEGVLLVGY